MRPLLLLRCPPPIGGLSVIPFSSLSRRAGERDNNKNNPDNPVNPVKKNDKQPVPLTTPARRSFQRRRLTNNNQERTQGSLFTIQAFDPDQEIWETLA